MPYEIIETNDALHENFHNQISATRCVIHRGRRLFTKHLRLTMPIYNVCSRKFYEKDGEKKIKWYKVGFLKETEAGKKYLHLHMLPQTEFFLFERDATLPEVQVEE